MRATLGCILALALAATPALARANGPADNGSAAGSDSASAAKSDAAAKPDAATMESELEELRTLLESQASQLQDQNQELKDTQEKIQALEKQLKASTVAATVNASPAASAVSSSGMPVAEVPASSSSSSSSASTAAPQALPAARGITTASLDTTLSLSPTYGTNPALPEPQAASPLSFRIGGAEFTPGGFMDLTDVFRTRDNGGSIGTSFSGVLYKVPSSNNAYPITSEDRFSAQNSRISLRVDSSVAGGKVVGYVETDFLGAPGSNSSLSNLNTTSNSAGLRLRVYFVDYTRGHFEFLAGQDWSMFTSNRNGIGFMPGDVFYTQDMDTNYQVGLLWERTPQFRFVYHANSDLALGFSMEDPDQYIPTTTTTPSGAANFLNQFDGTGVTPNVPNLLPDIVAKIAYDHMLGGRHIHIEGEGDFRTLRLVNYTTNGSNGIVDGPSNKVEGITGAINSNWEIFKNFRLIENIDWGTGDGRLIANTGVPDAIIVPASAGFTTQPYTLSPVHAGAFIGGFEWQATPKFMLYGYDGGVYISKDFATVAGTQYGWGVGGAAATVSVAEGQNRFVQEPTVGIIVTMWRNPQYGALQLITQASYVQRSPWVVVPATPTVATDTMAWADIRYTLP